MGRAYDASDKDRIVGCLLRHAGNVTATAGELGVERRTVQRVAAESRDPRVEELLKGRGYKAMGAAPTPTPAEAAVDMATAGRWASITATLKKTPLTLDAIAAKAEVSRGAALDWIEARKAAGANIREAGDAYSIEKTPPVGLLGGFTHEYVSRPDNTFVFGAMGDTHIGSKYFRGDVLDSLYDAYAEAGVDRVYHTGNWVDGEARFNKFDLDVHGMDAQIREMARVYPRKPGIDTYAVAGDDHEGWYGQREGIDIGAHAEALMHRAGRTDWHDIGYMESAVKLVNCNTGAEAAMYVVHPGGGSSYALSYVIQKIIESYGGGEKPAVGLYGHYHKLLSMNYRNVWAVMTGTTQDQNPFMRKKRLEAHVGGMLIRMRQDPETGAIVGFQPDMLRYFNRGFYSGRWSHGGEVVLPERSINA